MADAWWDVVGAGCLTSIKRSCAAPPELMACLRHIASPGQQPLAGAVVIPAAFQASAGICGGTGWMLGTHRGVALSCSMGALWLLVPGHHQPVHKGCQGVLAAINHPGHPQQVPAPLCPCSVSPQGCHCPVPCQP